MDKIRLRNFVFTINNYTHNDVANCKNLPFRYIVFGYETGENGTPHLQGYCELPNALTFSSLKKKLPRAHIEKRKGTAEQASEYCKKDQSFYESGEISKQGKRTDIETVIEMVDDGNSNKSIAIAEPVTYFKFHKHINAYRAATLLPRDEVPTVQVFYGATGTGKSHTAREIFHNKNYYVWSPNNLKWWDGYTGQKYIIMEEFRGQLPFSYMLTLLDRYECKVEYKGGIIEFCGIHIIITSPIHPEEWFPNHFSDSADSLNQLLRRITEIKHFNIPYKNDTKVNDTEVAG